jgi:hypothetical protein
MAADLAFHFSAAVMLKDVPQSGWRLLVIGAFKILNAKVAKKGREGFVERGRVGEKVPSGGRELRNTRSLDCARDDNVKGIGREY